jgi:hypothetical protein
VGRRKFVSEIGACPVFKCIGVAVERNLGVEVDFIVIGAMKCATSTICAYLEDHPDVFMVKGEPNFFSHDGNYSKGEKWYMTHFKGRNGEIIAGEGSNFYSASEMYPHTVARMIAFNPQLKLVYMVRHPIDRIVSAWIQSRSDRGDDVSSTLDLAVTEHPEFFIDLSLYWKNITRYRTDFPSDQIFVGFMEDLHSDDEDFFKRLCKFLGVPPNPTIGRDHLNQSLGKTIPTRLYTVMNQLPFAGGMKKFTPRPLKNFVRRRLLSKRLSSRPEFSPRIRERVVKALREDAVTFLSNYGKPVDFWTLE